MVVEKESLGSDPAKVGGLADFTESQKEKLCEAEGHSAATLCLEVGLNCCPLSDIGIKLQIHIQRAEIEMYEMLLCNTFQVWSCH